MKKPAPPTKKKAGFPKQLSFVPTPALSRITPRHTSADGRLLELLLQGQSVSQYTWLKMGEGWRLAAAIGRLKAMHWPIERDMLTYQSRGKKPISYASYRIEPETIAEVQP